MVTIIVSAIYGMVVGVAWNFALYNNFGGWIYGSIIGAIVGFLTHVIQIGVAGRGRLTKKEVFVVASHMTAYMLGLGILTAFIAYFIRLIFF